MRGVPEKKREKCIQCVCVHILDSRMVDENKGNVVLFFGKGLKWLEHLTNDDRILTKLKVSLNVFVFAHTSFLL